MTITMLIAKQIAKATVERLSTYEIAWSYYHKDSRLTIRRVNSIRLSENKDTWMIHIKEIDTTSCKDLSIHKDNIVDFEIFEND